MALLTPSLISPTTSKLFSYLPFSNHNKTHAQSNSPKSPDLPTYITIVMRKDGTPTTKCLNPPSNRYSSNRRRRSSFSSYQSLCSPPKQRRLMISSFIPRFPRRNSNSLSLSNSNSSSSSTISRETVLATFNCSQPAISVTADAFSQTNRKRKLLFLPSELTIKILLSLDCESLLKLAQTCKQFYKLCHKHHEYLWQTLFQTDYNQKNLKSLPNISYYDLYKNHLELDRRWKYGKVNTRYLTGHEDSVYCLVWVGSNRVVSGSRDRSIKLWNLDEKKGSSLVLTKTGHEGSVLCLRVSADMSFLVSGSSDATCLIWSLPDFLPQKRLAGHSGGVLDVCIIGGMIVSSSRDATIRVWDKNSGSEMRRLIGHAGPVNALGSHGGRVVSASGDTTLKLWDIETGNCLRTFAGHTRGLACVRFDGQFIYSGGQDNKLKIWDADTGKCVSTLAGHSDLIRTIDSFEAVSGSYDRTLRVWNAKESKCLLSFQSGHSSWIFNCLLSRTKIISAGQDKRIMVLDFGYDLTTME
ncbi:WD40-repeat-containing domain protein [Mucor mucedo]|uniref:WD40-repeat-containing domain protein n=1 Tax=Mucor mucedo TaxID=29922 RepID=UPI0022205933|nr:WD40-repeat-containing domain protein [Mucor mucedo]KAI7868034.1 WD40-repeat-containing domain protein [Mucor mucedo]